MCFVALGPERMTSTEDLSLYLRQWHPSTLTLAVPKEVVLKDNTVEALKEEVKQRQQIEHFILWIIFQLLFISSWLCLVTFIVGHYERTFLFCFASVFLISMSFFF